MIFRWSEWIISTVLFILVVPIISVLFRWFNVSGLMSLIIAVLIMIVTAFCFRRQIYLVKRILKKAASIKFFTEFIIIVFLLYILIVTFFGTLYFFIALFFRPEVSYFEWFYFSAITLTTVGFGDIIPLNSFMKLLVSIESFIGYIFPSVVFTIGLGIILRQNKI